MRKFTPDILVNNAGYVVPKSVQEMDLENTKRHFTRSDCLRLQTPQAFNYSLLKSAYATGKYTDMTDETRVLYEEYGIAPTILDGGENLYKVIYPKDLAFLEAHFSDFL